MNSESLNEGGLCRGKNCLKRDSSTKSAMNEIFKTVISNSKPVCTECKNNLNEISK